MNTHRAMISCKTVSFVLICIGCMHRTLAYGSCKSLANCLTNVECAGQENWGSDIKRNVCLGRKCQCAKCVQFKRCTTDSQCAGMQGACRKLRSIPGTFCNCASAAHEFLATKGKFSPGPLPAYSFLCNSIEGLPHCGGIGLTAVNRTCWCPITNPDRIHIEICEPNKKCSTDEQCGGVNPPVPGSPECKEGVCVCPP